ncbi:MAG: single-stranded-DNA-specific exonuclease RecJ [Gammaproteobacteria bacterium]|nr:MAG: single-stranded-DNA-specific exonuclease RecJ [Gammaproteobacteria bacterium]
MPPEIKRRTHSEVIDLPNDIHPVLRRIYAARNIKTADDLDYSLQKLLPYEDLSNIQEAVALLAEAIKSNKRILIVADFDADGATSCAVGMQGLRQMGATDVLYVVPNRFEFGYGLSPEIVEVAAERNPDLLVTVDNGISSVEGVQRARDKGIDVLITDHHLPGEQLPNANAIVNPNQAGDKFPSKMLAGVGVMFYILVALRAHLRDQNWFQEQKLTEPNLAELLDLVALGTVADVVPMDRNNRLLVSQGLARIRSGKCRPGIKALLLAANRTLERVTAQDMGFAVGPRLNAAGRLSDMSLGIECLMSDDEMQARNMAVRLDDLNKERREIQNDMQEQALIDITELDLDDAEMPFGVCLFNEDWHQGVIGILASKIKDKLHRPVIAFAKDKDGFIKGSARSISCVHIRDVLDTIAGQNPGLIDKFGGHAMAAGMTLKEIDFEAFKQAFDQELRRFIAEEDLNGSLLSDGELTATEITFGLANDIQKAGPWGQGFPEPQFDGEFELVESRIVGEKHLKLQLRAQVNGRGQGKVIDAIAFNFTDEAWQEKPERVHTVYRLDINEFRGRRQLQLMIENIEPV